MYVIVYAFRVMDYEGESGFEILGAAQTEEDAATFIKNAKDIEYILDYYGEDEDAKWTPDGKLRKWRESHGGYLFTEIYAEKVAFV